MSAATGRRAAWALRLRTAGLSTPERLIAGQLLDRLTRPTPTAVDVDDLASCCALAPDVARAALDGLHARRLVAGDAAGRLTLTLPDGGSA